MTPGIFYIGQVLIALVERDPGYERPLLHLNVTDQQGISANPGQGAGILPKSVKEVVLPNQNHTIGSKIFHVLVDAERRVLSKQAMPDLDAIQGGDEPVEFITGGGKRRRPS
jgi:hypothetical protein